MPQSAATDLIQRLALQPHPEGGWYRETYRATQRVLRDRVATETRAAATAIHYLLCDGAYSAWHRIASDEVWHFHAGDALLVHVFTPEGDYRLHRVGDALRDADAVFQAVVPAGCWFAAELADPAGFALVGCTVAPGFEFSEFALADAPTLAALSSRHPTRRALIARLAPRPR